MANGRVIDYGRQDENETVFVGREPDYRVSEMEVDFVCEVEIWLLQRLANRSQVGRCRHKDSNLVF